MGLFSRKCITCKKATKDVLHYSPHKTSKFCREHLVEEFSNEFRNFAHKIVFFHPDDTQMPIASQLPYYPETDKTVSLGKETADVRASYYDHIVGGCSECEREASVLYFAPHLLPYKKTGFFNEPQFNEVQPTQGTLLCKRCALNKITPILLNNPKAFADGLYVPFMGDGVFVKTEL